LFGKDLNTSKYQKVKSRALTTAVIVLLFISGLTCNKSGIIGGGPQNVTTSIAGRVLDQNKIPLGNVQVEASGKISATDINGNFSLDNVIVNSDNAVVKMSRSGYFTSYRTFTPTANSMNYVEVTLVTKTVSGSFSGATGGVVSVPNGGSINFPASSMTNTANNAAYTGSVAVSAFFINPTASDFRNILPGDLRGINTTGQQVGLQSFGMMAIELDGSGGEKLQLASGKQATVNFPIPASLASQAPATIPLWFFDESIGQWKEEGTAQKQGSNYVGTVSHFSFWNCDAPFPVIEFTAIVQDNQNHILPEARIQIRRPNGSLGFGYTDANGKVIALVPANELLKMTVIGQCSRDSLNIGPFSSDSDVGILHVNASAPNITATISGTVANCSGGPVTNGYVTIDFDGINYRANINNGSFNQTINRCNNNPATATITATDVGAVKQSNPLNINVTSGTVNTGQINTCVTLTNFINFTISGISTLMTPRSDSLDANVQFGMQTMIDGFDIDSSANRSFRLGFLANTPVTVPIDLLKITVGSNFYVKLNNPIITVTLTEFGGSGQYIAGNFAGNIRDSTHHTNVPITCNFRVRRY
jgi:hypothetical protein